MSNYIVTIQDIHDTAKEYNVEFQYDFKRSGNNIAQLNLIAGSTGNAERAIAHFKRYGAPDVSYRFDDCRCLREKFKAWLGG